MTSRKTTSDAARAAARARTDAPAPAREDAQARGDTPATEIELKFQVPADALERVRKAVGAAGARTATLRTVYLDTADGRLAAARIALRLRHDGRRWLQTLKVAGADVLVRAEHEVAVEPPPAGVDLPTIDLSRHAGEPASEALERALEGQTPVAVYETRVTRTTRLVRCGSTRIELALDEGTIVAGSGMAAPARGQGRGRRGKRSGAGAATRVAAPREAAALSLCELEFEWKGGPLAGLFELAGRWTDQHALVLDVRSKSERGHLLAHGLRAAPATLASHRALPKRIAARAGLQRIVGQALAHLLPNTSALAARTAEPEHLHQARVALRRLRTALQLFGDDIEGVDAGWSDALAHAFRALGDARDVDALEAGLLPALRAASAPVAKLKRPDHAADPGAPWRTAERNRLLLDLLAFSADEAPATTRAEDRSQTLEARAAQALSRLHRQVRRAAKQFASLSDEERHRTRRQVKRLRYGLEFVAGSLPKKATRRYLDRLEPAQEALGHFNDLTVADAAFRARTDKDPRAWFSVGWLAAQRPATIEAAAQALEKLRDATPPWR